MTGIRDVTFGDVLSGELRKAFTGSTWYVVFLLGAALAALTVVGAAAEAPQFLESGASIADVTAMTLRFWFMTLLSSGLFGVLFVTREFNGQRIVRSALLAGTRGRLFTAKLVASTVMGLLYAALSAGLIFATLAFFEPLAGTSPEWSESATLTTFGVAAVVTVAAPWGTAIGWLIRSSVGAVGVFLVLTLIVDEGLFRLAPEVGRFTMQIAMGSVYQDGKADALPPEWGAVVMVAWLVLALAAAAVLLRRRDLT